MAAKAVLHAIIFAAGLSSAAVCLAEAGFDIDRVAGRYSHRFTEHMMDGETYAAADSLRIVRHGRSSAYFETFLSFANGHSCSLSGIANVEAGALVYRQANTGSGACEFTMRVVGGKVVFADKGFGCSTQYCGMRGSLDGASFDLAWRRADRGLRNLYRSQSYRDAVGAHGRRRKPTR